MPEIISDAIYSFEEYFKSIYSDEELKEISTFIESETGKKVISDTYVFNELHKYRNHMRDELNEEINRNEATERMNKKISELIVTLSLPDSSNDDYNH